MNEEIILEKFAKRFSELIKNSSIEVPKLAEMLGIKSKSTIYRYMNAEMAPKLTTVKYASEIFNVNPLWLTGYDVPMERNLNTKLESSDISNILKFKYGESSLKLLDNYNKLNNLGKQTADIYVKDLTEIPKYTVKTSYKTRK